jgi:hypothetical protein
MRIGTLVNAYRAYIFCVAVRGVGNRRTRTKEEPSQQNRYRCFLLLLLKMKAVGVKRYGASEVLEDFTIAETPAPTGFDLLVRVHAVSVNPVDWKVRAGWFDEPGKTFDPPKVSACAD